MAMFANYCVVVRGETPDGTRKKRNLGLHDDVPAGKGQRLVRKLAATGKYAKLWVRYEHVCADDAYEVFSWDGTTFNGDDA